MPASATYQPAAAAAAADMWYCCWLMSWTAMQGILYQDDNIIYDNISSPLSLKGFKFLNTKHHWPKNYQKTIMISV